MNQPETQNKQSVEAAKGSSPTGSKFVNALGMILGRRGQLSTLHALSNRTRLFASVLHCPVGDVQPVAG